jgi:hypothetical protein
VDRLKVTTDDAADHANGRIQSAPRGIQNRVGLPSKSRATAPCHRSRRGRESGFAAGRQRHFLYTATPR